MHLAILIDCRGDTDGYRDIGCVNDGSDHDARDAGAAGRFGHRSTFHVSGDSAAPHEESRFLSWCCQYFGAFNERSHLDAKLVLQALRETRVPIGINSVFFIVLCQNHFR